MRKNKNTLLLFTSVRVGSRPSPPSEPLDFSDCSVRPEFWVWAVEGYDWNMRIVHVCADNMCTRVCKKNYSPIVAAWERLDKRPVCACAPSRHTLSRYELWSWPRPRAAEGTALAVPWINKCLCTCGTKNRLPQTTPNLLYVWGGLGLTEFVQHWRVGS